MRLKLGTELSYTFDVPTPMIVMLNVHPDEAQSLEYPDTLATNPIVNVTQYRDGFGNLCCRLIAPPGPFTITTSGADEPITLCGTSASVLDGGAVDSGYALHLDHVADWVLTGFRVTGGQKGIVLDGVATTTLTGLEVSGTGQEAVHLRAGSSDNVIDGLVIHDTGRSTPEFGEGVYIGTAASNWCTVTACEPDRSDRNRVTGTTVFDVTAEAIDVKEGTSDGVISGNTLSIADAAAVGILLVAAERGVRRHRPAEREIGMRVRPADIVDPRDLLLKRLGSLVVRPHRVDEAVHHAFLARAIVR